MCISKSKNIVLGCHRKKRTSILMAILFAITLVFAGGSVWAAVWRVDRDSQEPPDGMTWGTAYQTIQGAVDAASDGDEIWVKKGNTLPYQLTSTINVGKAVSIYGGFSGTETDKSQRSWQTNLTIVDGSLGYFPCFDTSANANIDGFTITGCYSFGSGAAIAIHNGATPLTNTIANCTFSENPGSAVGIDNSNFPPPNNSSATVTSCTFSGNVGALYIDSTSATVTKCTFTENNGSGISMSYANTSISNCNFSGNYANHGGGISMSNSDANISNCTFTGNSVHGDDSYPSGGAIYSLTSSFHITNCTFSGNSSPYVGGAIYSFVSSFTITNSTFSGNTSAGDGGGIYVTPGIADSTLTNCTFSGNHADNMGGGIYGGGGHYSTTVTNSILWYNTAPLGGQGALTGTMAVSYSDVQDGTAGIYLFPDYGILDWGAGNISGNPSFVNSSTDFHLQAGSPCIDTGSNSVPGGVGNLDLDGNTRIVNGTVDMGAYEYQQTLVVDSDGDGIPDSTDNCPYVYNPDQKTAACHGDPPPAGTPGIVCDPDPMCVTSGNLPSGSLATAPSADGTIYIDVTVTLQPINGKQTPYVKPDAYNVVLHLFDSTGKEIFADQIQCGPPCSLPDDLVPVSSPTNFSTTIPLSHWFTNLQPGSYTASADYINYCNDPALGKDGTCPPGGDCLSNGHPEYAGIFQGTVPLNPTTPITLTLGSNKTLDQCPNSSGNAGGTGCPFADKNTVTLHIVNLGGGPSTQQPLPMALVRVFDTTNSAFLAVAGKSNPDGSKYGIIFEANAGSVGECVTDGTGVCYVGERTKGNYLVIVKYDDPDTEKHVYTGSPKGPSDFNSSGIATKEFQIMKVFNRGVFQEYRGGSKIVVTGSILEVIAPDSSVWEGTSSIYPFVFTSDSNWSVDVCASVPSGYNIVGVYDENGNLVPSSNCVQTFVSGQTITVAFEVVETGSPEPSLTSTLTMTSPKGKKVGLTVETQDIRKKTFDDELGKALGHFKK